jgi:hypothetical protein
MKSFAISGRSLRELNAGYEKLFGGHATSLLPDATTNPPPPTLTLDRRGRLGGHLRVAAVSLGAGGKTPGTVSWGP